MELKLVLKNELAELVRASIILSYLDNAVVEIGVGMTMHFLNILMTKI